uniref:Cobalamin-independent methionine synthase MetE N-terminal domain-containing protein n=1 Tax=Triticum urartu TaxID=4572 RepID=A0A8R7Q0B9_TRIUA
MMMPSCLRGTLLSFRPILAALYPHHGSWLDPKWRPLVRVACLHGTAKHSQYTETSWLSQRKMASHIVGYPRMGPKRELKFALESFWDGKSSAEDLEKVAADLRASIWKQMSEAGIKYIPSNTFSYYDQVLDTTAMLGAVPDRYSWTGGEIGYSTYFSMARGNATVPAMEMTKWFDTNYHFIVPELSPATKFSYASHKAVSEYKEAKAVCSFTHSIVSASFS